MAALNEKTKDNLYKEINNIYTNNEILMNFIKSEEVQMYINKITCGFKVDIENKVDGIVSLVIKI